MEEVPGTTFGFEDLQAEAVTFRRSIGTWPSLVLSGLVQDTVLFLEIEIDDLLDFESQTVQAMIRTHVEPRISQLSLVTLAVVKPPPTVREQDGQDALYVLIGEEMHPCYALAMVVIWDHRLGENIDIHPLELPQRMMTETLLEVVGLARRCMIPFVTCTVKHAEHELPLLVSWRPFHGMKIVIDVEIKRCDVTPQTWSGEMIDASFPFAEYDTTWMMQRQLPRQLHFEVIQEYAAEWTMTTVEITFWFHMSVEE